MSTQNLYCHNCKRDYNVRVEDLELMHKHHKDFDKKEYKQGCFFKELGSIKRSLKQVEQKTK